MLFQHSIPTPVEITKAATRNEPSDSRNLPTSGLTPNQMARAIRELRLEPFLVSASDPHVFRSTICGYLQGDVPLILGIHLVDTCPMAPSGADVLGQHAVTVTGFSLPSDVQGSGARRPFALRGDRIDKIYVHDDQLGPFARMELDGQSVTIEKTPHWSMGTSWSCRHKNRNVRAVPYLFSIPLYHKIRIPYESVEERLRAFDTLLDNIPGLASLEPLEWDLHLTIGGKLKERVFRDELLSGADLETFLLKSLPRFVWRATARTGTQDVLDLVFDATDIPQGDVVEHAIVYDARIEAALRGLLASNRKADLENRPFWPILRYFDVA